MTQINEIYQKPASEERLALLSKELEEATNLFLEKINKLEKVLVLIEE